MEAVLSEVRRVLNRRTWSVLLPAQVVFTGLLVWSVADTGVRHAADYFADLVTLLPVLMMPVGAVVAGNRTTLREYLAKLAALLLTTVILVLPVLTAAWVVVRLVPAGAAFADRPGHGLGVVVWGTVVAVIGGWTGLALKLVAGSGAVAVGLAWFWVLIEIRLLVGIDDHSDNVSPWLFLVNTNAVIGHGTSYEVLDPSNPIRGTGSDELSFGRGLRYCAALTGVAVVVGGIAGLVRRQVGSGR